MNILNLKEALITTKSTKSKIEILKRNKTCPHLFEIFIPYLDTHITYGYNKFNLDLITDCDSETDLSYFIEFLKSQEGKLKSDKRTERFLTSISELTPEYQLFCVDILTNKLKIGVSRKLWNKAFPNNSINVHEVMLATSKNNIKDWKFPYIVQPKIDGCRAQLSGDIITLRSGKNIKIHNLFNYNYKFPLDGELIYNDDISDRTTINGIINKAINNTSTIEEESKISFVVFDHIIPELTYIERFIKIYSLYENKRVSKINHKIVNSLSEVEVEFKEQLNLGNEGIILRNPNSKWKSGRSKELIKFKAEKEADLKIVEIIEGQGKFTDTTGSVLLESSDGIVQVKVGTGFTDVGRDFIWSKRELLIGKIIEVKFNELVGNKKDSERFSLFLPVLGSVRIDKTDANSYLEISKI